MADEEIKKGIHIATKIHVHIFKERKFFEGTMLTISVLGAKIKCKGKIGDLHTIRVGFIFDNKEYTLDAHITKKLPNDEYKIAFSYSYIVDKMGIKYSIEDICRKNN